ncbi:MAG: cellulase family glycosylhydrolase [Candidatus Omnitrophica bacterium]|nr:cellulase family glycosylhydrolase [Candidatus Omnitrophota bacterium]
MSLPKCMIIIFISGLSLIAQPLPTTCTDSHSENSVDFSQVFSHSFPDKWSLWIEGPHLRGANIYQRRVYPNLDGNVFFGAGPMGPPYKQEDFDKLAEWGANYVNISYSGFYSENPPYLLDPIVQDGLDRLLDMIEKADMFAVISFRSGPGRSEFSLYYWKELDIRFFNDSLWQDAQAQDAWAAMWRYTAERYRNNPIVVGYDLMVEPNSNDSGSDYFKDRLDIWEPDEFYNIYKDTLYDWNQLYPRITKAIREEDPETPILIGGNSYSGVRWLPFLEPTGDSRTIYTVHQYEPQEQYTHIEWYQANFELATYPGLFDLDWDGKGDRFNRDWLDDLLSTIDVFKKAHNAPVAVNEFGVNRWVENAADFMRDQMELFEQRGLNHAVWEWQPSWAPLAEEDSMNFRHGPDPHNHTDVGTSALIEVIKQFWRRNQIRPSLMPQTQSGIMDFSILNY